jgi:hypothetical protein
MVNCAIAKCEDPRSVPFTKTQLRRSSVHLNLSTFSWTRRRTSDHPLSGLVLVGIERWPQDYGHTWSEETELCSFPSIAELLLTYSDHLQIVSLPVIIRLNKRKQIMGTRVMQVSICRYISFETSKCSTRPSSFTTIRHTDLTPPHVLQATTPLTTLKICPF